MTVIDCHVKYSAGIPRAVLLLGLVCLATPATAQNRPPGEGSPVAGSLEELTAAPEAAAALYLRSIRAIRWTAVAQFLAPSTLERFRTTATMIADADTTGALRTFLVDADSAGMAALAPDDVFARSIGAVIDDLPGLMHALYDRDDEVLGAVPDGPDRAHVVYRTTARLSGAVPQVEVMQLERGRQGWRVLWSDELDVIEEALRGVGR